MKKILSFVLIILGVVTTTQAQRYAAFGVGYGNIRTIKYEITNKSTKSYKVLGFSEDGISAGQSLKNGNVSSSNEMQIVDLLEEKIAELKADGIPSTNCYLFFSSSWESISDEKKTKITKRLESEVGLTPDFTDAYSEGKAMTQTTIPKSDVDFAAMIFYGSSTTKGGCLARKENGKYGYNSFDLEIGVAKVKDKFLKSDVFEDDIRTFAKGTYTDELEAALSQTPIIKQRKILYLCGDAPYYIARLLGSSQTEAYNLTPDQIPEVRRKLKSNKSALQNTDEVFKKVDEKFLLTALEILQATIDDLKPSRIVIAMDERTPALGLGIQKACE